MLKIQCPKCQKGKKSELLDVLPSRRYRLRCNDCGFTYLLVGTLNKEKEACKESRPPMHSKELSGLATAFLGTK